jgi:hydroxymethylpyrimidine pyrophosphatase-like HAD family hydrolase
MENRPKTLIVDIDGTLIHHFGSLSAQIINAPKMLPGVREKFDEWDKLGYRIILLTGRKESMREATVKQLQDLHIVYDQLVMGVGGGVRVLINDYKLNSKEPTAIAVNVERNEGIANINI